MISSDIKNDILNECLAALGEPYLTDGGTYVTNAEKWADNRFQTTVDSILQLRPWSGALREIILTAVSSADDVKPRYPLPEDFARMNFVRGMRDQDWKVEAGYLVTPTRAAGTVQICYNSSEVSRRWGGALRELMGLALAKKITKSVENSGRAKVDLKDDYMAALRKASAVEGAAQSGYVWREDLVTR